VIAKAEQIEGTENPPLPGVSLRSTKEAWSAQNSLAASTAESEMENRIKEQLSLFAYR